VSSSARSQRLRLSRLGVGALLAIMAVLWLDARAQQLRPPGTAAPTASAAWTTLSPAQQAALAPLKSDWQGIDDTRRQQWLEIAARFPAMTPEERQRIQERMAEWARMTPDERGRVRLQYQELRQISAKQRQERWDAYLALPAEERRALAEKARTVPKVAVAKSTAASPTRLAGADAAAQPAAKVVAPTVVQAKPGASTTLISRAATPPASTPSRLAKADVDGAALDRRTLLPQAHRPEAAASAAP